MWPFRSRPRDTRSGRVLFLIECLLNQNARDLGAAQSPASVGALVDLLTENEIGMAQIPCPEIACLGFARRRAPGVSIRQALQAPEPAACCVRLANETAGRIQWYVEQGYAVLAVLGGNVQSPACAVHESGGSSRLATERSGIFMLALADALAQRGLAIPLRGIRDADCHLLDEDLRWLRERL